ncbi:hypothetical protein [Paenibacillus campinasensis]|uniref:Uncharacterized protein n=1 Tax=Paenibacillus campinasensis TaxID=66347 RepID=A0A268ETD7_9BACL|nr:hypothetical protein [Paenibacillus campinasensis]PAD76389.1 hypothetical protein CHH67_12235 [Paenibacillus campinasensis]
MEPRTTYKRSFKKRFVWLFKSIRNYGHYSKTELAVAVLFIAILVVWGIFVLRWFVLIIIATMRHFGLV